MFEPYNDKRDLMVSTGMKGTYRSMQLKDQDYRVRLQNNYIMSNTTPDGEDLDQTGCGGWSGPTMFMYAIRTLLSCQMSFKRIKLKET